MWVGLKWIWFVFLDMVGCSLKVVEEGCMLYIYVWFKMI